MSINPRGFAVDWMRSAEHQNCLFWAITLGEPVLENLPVYWYRTLPGTPCLAHENLFTSARWTDRSDFPFQGLGMYPLSDQWSSGAFPSWSGTPPFDDPYTPDQWMGLAATGPIEFYTNAWGA